jgi:hypothetical protein
MCGVTTRSQTVAVRALNCGRTAGHLSRRMKREVCNRPAGVLRPSRGMRGSTGLSCECYMTAAYEPIAARSGPIGRQRGERFIPGDGTKNSPQEGGGEGDSDISACRRVPRAIRSTPWQAMAFRGAVPPIPWSLPRTTRSPLCGEGCRGRGAPVRPHIRRVPGRGRGRDRWRARWF